ncbi:DUF4145 domain-containing protein [Mesorhizobium sp. B2-3-4]|uniref:DUF4145 domain-containing protein n=1 Tax=Mesorhizobium sp. B2-3-4 TaxID=2589959 RepID=UPI00112CB42C|nr:DUF4145 domain-containing protein [Mesorhizobium sp. B2-3-4]TPM39597.1 DUF4145 domain-containing protein [Mesorhizobium sp. B2-3-4]
MPTYPVRIGSASTTDSVPTINLRCPRCRHEGAFHSIHAAKDVLWENIEKVNNAPVSVGRSAIGMRQCPNEECRGFIFVVLFKGKLIESFPPQVIDFDASSLPPKILSSLDEAIRCHSAGCFRAAALMVRRVLEELCDDKSATGNNLKARISALSSTIVVPPDLLAAADELRLLGNDAAHIEAQVYDAIEAEEIEVAIDLAKELLKAVYQYTSLVARMKALKKPSVP